MAECLVANGIVNCLVDILNRKALFRVYVTFCVKILGNLMYASDYIVDVSIIIYNNLAYFKL
jgi:hypothetical protein